MCSHPLSFALCLPAKVSMVRHHSTFSSFPVVWSQVQHAEGNSVANAVSRGLRRRGRAYGLRGDRLGSAGCGFVFKGRTVRHAGSSAGRDDTYARCVHPRARRVPELEVVKRARYWSETHLGSNPASGTTELSESFEPSELRCPRY